MNYLELFREDRVLLDSSAGDASSVLRTLAATLTEGEPSLAGREAEVLAALEERELQGSTGSQGVAIPHVKIAGLAQVRVALLVHEAGVDFRALDGEQVHVFFGVLRPEETANEHLGLLRWIANIAENGDFVPFARQAGNPAGLVELLQEMTPA